MKIRRFKMALYIFLFFSCMAVARADDTTDAVMSVAQSKTSSIAMINYSQMPVIYVGKFDGCEAVAIHWTGDGIRNYRVCNGIVNPRDSVSPAWDAGTGKPTLDAVMNEAINNGAAAQKDANGYLVSATRLNTALNARCAKYQVIISYDGDLVDDSIISDCSH